MGICGRLPLQALIGSRHLHFRVSFRPWTRRRGFAATTSSSVVVHAAARQASTSAPDVQIKLWQQRRGARVLTQVRVGPPPHTA
jgi:hypothetical protein